MNSNEEEAKISQSLTSALTLETAFITRRKIYIVRFDCIVGLPFRINLDELPDRLYARMFNCHIWDMQWIRPKTNTFRS